MSDVAPKKWYQKWYVIAGIIIVVLMVVSNMSGSEGSSSTPEASAKTYQQVATFSGNGAKKSEPFNIQGDRFKITYDCKGDPAATLCTAFVFKVGSSLPQAVMNSTQAVKDETIIYTNMAGKGEYYIDANVLGSFSMTVSDYK